MRLLGSAWFSLRGRLGIFLAAAVLGMAGVSFYSFSQSWSRTYNDTYRIFQVAEGEIAGQIEGHLKKYRNLAGRAGYFYAVQNFLLSYDPGTVIASHQQADGYLFDLNAGEPGVGNIFLYSHRGRYLSSNGNSVDELKAIAREYPLTGDRPALKPFFALYPGVNGKDLLVFIYPVFNIAQISRSGSIICILLCNGEAISAGFPAMDKDPDGAAVLLFNNTIVSASRKIDPAEQTVIENLQAGGGGGNRDYLTLQVSLDRPNWNFIYIIPRRVMILRVFSRLGPGIPLLCLVIITALIFLVFLMRSVYTGMTIIVENINALEYGQPKRPYGGPPFAEIKQISHSIDAMVHRLDRAFAGEQRAQRKLLEARAARTRAEFQSYRFRINPHFLFNTLECARAMAGLQDNAVMEELITSMAQIFRYSLYAEAEVPLERELEHLREFMKVINIRYNGQYRLKIQSSGGAEQYRLPSMILQPLAENAVSHGFSTERGRGKNILVQALAAAPPGGLLLRVTDNGGGLSAEAAETLNRKLRDTEDLPEGAENDGPGGALFNVCRRMRLRFGAAFHLRIKSKPGYYTAVELYVGFPCTA